MAQLVKLKRTSVQGRIPTTSNLELGELAINTYDGRIFFEKNDGSPSVQEILTTNTTNSGSFYLLGDITASTFQGDGSNLTFGGTGLISGSSQLTTLGYAITGSNTFKGAQLIQNSAVGGNYSLTVQGSTTGDKLGVLTNNTSGVGITITSRNAANSANSSLNFSGSSYEFGGGDVTFLNNVTIDGTLTLSNADDIRIQDNTLLLNWGKGNTDGGLEVSAQSGGTGSLFWDESDGKWKGGTKGNEVAFLQAGNVSGLTSLNAYTASNDVNITNIHTVTSSFQDRLDSLESATSSYQTSGASNLGGGVVSGSEQITNFGFISGSDLDGIHSYTSSLKTAISVNGTNLTIAGNLDVQGTTTTVNSTNVTIDDNILELNYGGTATTSGILVKDATGASTTSGSLLWDATNDYWKLGKLNSEAEVITTTNLISSIDGNAIGTTSDIEATGSFTGSFKGEFDGDVGGTDSIDVSSFAVDDDSSKFQINSNGDPQRGLLYGLYHTAPSATLGYTAYGYSSTRLYITGGDISSTIKAGDRLTYTPLRNSTNTETAVVLEVLGTGSVVLDKEFNIGSSQGSFYSANTNLSFTIDRPKVIGGLGTDSDGVRIKSEAQFDENVNITKKARIGGDFLIDNDVTNISSTTIFLNSDTIEGSGEFEFSLIPKWGYAPSAATPSPTYNQNFINLGSSSKAWKNIYGNNIIGGNISGSSFGGTGLLSGSQQVIDLLPSGIISGSQQVNADSVTNFDSNVKDKMNADGVISGSTQLEGEFLQINGDSVVSSSAQISGYNTFLEINGDGVVSGSSQINTLFVGTAVSTSLDSRLDSLQASTHTHSNKANLDTINQDLATTDNVTFANGNFTGNLTVDGTLTLSNADDIRIEDNNLLLNYGKGNADGGLEISAQSGGTGSLLWDESDGKWKGGTKGNELAFLQEGHSIFSGSFSGSFQGDGSNLTGISVDAASTVSSTFTNSSSVTVSHNFNTRNILVAVYDNQNNLILPQNVNTSNLDQVVITLSSGTSGTVVVAKGGHIISGSAGDSDKLNGQTADYYLDYDNFTDIPDGIVSGSSQTIKHLPTGVVSGSQSDARGQLGLDTGDSPTFTDLTLSGDLIVQGTTTTLNTTTFNVEDNIIELNYGGTAIESGIYVKDSTGGSTTSGSLLWDATNDYWKAGTSGSESKVLLANGDNIVSSSAQTILHLGGTGIISGSSQLDGTSIGATSDIIASGSFSGSFVGDGSGLTGIQVDQIASVTASFSNQSTINVSHNFDTRNVLVSTYDSSYNQLIPQSVSLTDSNTARVILSSAQSGHVVVAKGGHVVSGSTDADNINGFDTKVKTKLTAENVISGSTQITDLTTYKETVSGASSYTINHNLNESYPIVQAWSTGTSQQEVPQTIQTNSVNQVSVVFSTTFAGVIIIKK